MITIDEAFADPMLLGAAAGDPTSWKTWTTVEKAAYGLPLNATERELFKQVSGGRSIPSKRVSELVTVAGRRSGKTKRAAGVTVYEACFVDHSEKLSPGEIGYVLLISPSIRQAKLAFSYCLAYLNESPILKQKIKSVVQDEIRLEGNIVIAVHPANFQTIRGRTLLACVFDESAYWKSENSNQPDYEIYRSVTPSLMATNGLLVIISSPYREIGLLHSKYEESFGQNDPDCLVIQGGTQLFNPLINAKVIERARKRDPISAAAEWDANFREGGDQFLPDECIDAAINKNRKVALEPQDKVKYMAFADASAGRGDAFTLCIGHQHENKFVCDVIKGRMGRFNPETVVAEYSELLKSYRINQVLGDAFSGGWVADAFAKNGIQYRKSKLNRSQLYLEALASFTKGVVDIPDHKQLVKELRLLQRKARATGDHVDHPKNAHDDFANALCGCIYLTMQERKRPRVSTFGPRIFKGDPAFDPMGFSRGI